MFQQCSKKSSTILSNSKGALTLNFATTPVVPAAAPAAADATAGGDANANNSNKVFTQHCRLCNIDGHSTLYYTVYHNGLVEDLMNSLIS